MRKSVRIAITAVFVASFVVAVPTVILYTSGYRLNWQRQRVQKTGLLQVETEPRGASVLIDGVRQKKYTPAAYSRLLPQEYDVRIEAPGRFPWQKRLEVRSGQTTFATGVTLYRDALPQLVSEKDVVDAAWNGSGTRVAYVARTEAGVEAGVATKDGEDALLARFPEGALAGAAVAWSPRRDDALLTGTVNGEARAWLWSSQGGTLVPLHDRFANGFVRARWTPDGDVAVTSADGAWLLAGGTGVPVRLLSATGVLDADARGRTGYALHRVTTAAGDARVTLERADVVSPVVLLELPAGRYSFLDGNADFLLVRDEGNRRIHAVAVNGGDVTTADGAHAVWEPRGQRLLVWNEYEIGAFTPATGKSELITRVGTAVSQAAWTPRGDGIFYAASDGLWFVEFDSRDARNVYRLASCAPSGDFAVAADRLRFACQIGNRHGFFERGL